MSDDGDERSSEATIFLLLNEIGIISQLSTAQFERCLPTDLNNSQFGVLNWFFRVDSEATPGRLATAFQVTAGAMTNTLKKLEAKKFIQVEPDANSGRKKKVTITAEGREIRQLAIASAAPMLQEFAAAFPTADIEKQVRELQKIRQYLDERRYLK